VERQEDCEQEVFVLDVHDVPGHRGRYDDVAHHTIYLAENYRQNLRDIEDLHRLSENPSFYVQNASVTDATLAPKGQSTLYVLLPVTHETGNVDWARRRRSFASWRCGRWSASGFATWSGGSHGEDPDAERMARGVRAVQGRDVFDGALAGPDAAPAAA
jgi:hypothetical protein